MKTLRIIAIILMSVGSFAQQPDSHAPQAMAQTAQQSSTQKCLAVYPVAGNKKGSLALGAASFGFGLIGMHGEYFVYVGSAGLSIADTKPKYNRQDLVKLENSGVRIVVSANKAANQTADVHVTVGSDDVTNPCQSAPVITSVPVQAETPQLATAPAPVVTPALVQAKESSVVPVAVAPMPHVLLVTASPEHQKEAPYSETEREAQQRAARNTVVVSDPSSEAGLGEQAKRAKQHTECLKLAANNPSITCK